MDQTCTPGLCLEALRGGLVTSLPCVPLHVRQTLLPLSKASPGPRMSYILSARDF